MSDKYKIYFYEIPASISADKVEAGWFRPKSTMNQYIYDRVVDVEKGSEFTRDQAIRIITRATGQGYKCEAQPPIIVVY